MSKSWLVGLLEGTEFRCPFKRTCWHTSSSLCTFSITPRPRSPQAASEPVTLCGWSSGARPFLPIMEWAVFALEPRLSQSCTAAILSSTQVSFLLSFPIGSSSHLEGSIFHSFSFISSMGILPQQMSRTSNSNLVSASEDMN